MERNNFTMSCCFCGKTIDSQKHKAIQIYFYIDDSEDKEYSTQAIPCHTICLRKRIHPKVPLILSDYSDEDEKEINIQIKKNNQIKYKLVKAIEIERKKYLILNYDFKVFEGDGNSEEWQYIPGDIVECFECENISGPNNLIAFRKIDYTF